ncbi:MAG: NAD(P)-dependent alcohol dehydrogenase [Nitrospinales bacterium]
MKAIVYTEYGSPDVLRLTEVEKPTPNDDEVLIRVKAVSLNASDWELMCGKPLYARIFGLLKPRINILGSDVAGRVEGVGKNVTRFKIGDEVFGDLFNTFGGFSEYVCGQEKILTPKPSSISWEQASTLPQAACIALQGIRDEGKVQTGQHVLINGGGGGAGTFAIQLAKHFGAEVTGVDNAGKLEFMRSLGADHVIDYAVEDFTKNKKRYDLILDLAAYHSLFDYKRALTSRGTYLMVGGCMGLLLQCLHTHVAWRHQSRHPYRGRFADLLLPDL